MLKSRVWIRNNIGRQEMFCSYAVTIANDIVLVYGNKQSGVKDLGCLICYNIAGNRGLRRNSRTSLKVLWKCGRCVKFSHYKNSVHQGFLFFAIISGQCSLEA